VQKRVHMNSKGIIVSTTTSAVSLLALLAAGCMLAGCSFAPSVGSQNSVAPTVATGRVMGGQQPVAGATIQLFTVGTAMDGTGSTSMLTDTVTTDAFGGFTITKLYSCSNATQVYLLATRGNPAQTMANPNIALMAALGPCTSLSQYTAINVNELTTVAAVYALAPYMTSATEIGSGSSDATALAAAFTLASEYVNYGSGLAPGAVPPGMTFSTATINHLADIVATCINSPGGTAGDQSPCGNLFSYTTVGTSVPTDTVLALHNLALNPTLNTLNLYNASTANGPFQPQLSTPPPDWRVRFLSATPTLTVSPSSLMFAATPVGLPSVPQTVTLTNSSTASLTLSSIAVTGTNASDVAQSNNCGTTLLARGTCTVQVAVTPAAAGVRSAYIGIATSTGDSPQYVPIGSTGASSGTGPVLKLSTSTLSFTQAAESASAASMVTVTNIGTAPLTVSGISFSGANAPSFTETDTCSAAIAPNGTCIISITFTPFLATANTATLSVASNAGIPQTVALSGTGTGSLTIDTSQTTRWLISTGKVQIEWNSQTCHITNVYYNNSSGNNMVDTTTTSGGLPDGLYMDNTGTNLNAGTVTANYYLSPSGNFVDWWCQTASNSTNAFTTTMHYIATANDTGFHVYNTIGHSATDIAGNIGQWQYVFRIDLKKFVSTYSNNSGLNNPGPTLITQPTVAETSSTDPGRAVQNAAEDLHGFTDLPASFTRLFYTKYDYSSYEYLHQEHGAYGSQYGAWTVLPSTETLAGGPSKQDLIFTNNILIMEMQSGHLNSNLAYNPPQGVATTRLFGPFYFHFNQFTTTLTTPGQLYQDAQAFLPSFNSLYDNDPTLASYGYAASTARGNVTATIAGLASATPNTAWVVLSDNATNQQYTSTGMQYWQTTTNGTVNFTGIVPGTYRLTAYVLGQFGELRYDGLVVTANQTTVAPALTFTPEAFGTAAPIWTIGTPDRSSHEFLHGEDANGHDFRNFYGAYNYWADFASTNGQQIYYATAVGGTPATNDLTKLNYVQWGGFDPGLFGGYYNASDDTTDGLKYILPSYVTSVTQAVPNTAIHFTTSTAQRGQGSYVELSMGVPCTEASITPVLNSHSITWHYINSGDCMVRSGFSGYYQWVVFEWPVADLNAAGVDNVLTLGPSQTDGFMLDSLRLEITTSTSNPAITGWHDYEWVSGSSYTGANDAVPNNGH
jgi:hypothetical protein